MCRADGDGVQPWLAIVGLGLDGWYGLADEARRAIENASFIIGGERHLAMLPDTLGAEQQSWPRPFAHGIEQILARRGQPVVVLATGDAFWYGVGATLVRHVSAEAIIAWPQPSAFSLAAARLGWALQHVTCLSLHGRALTRLIPALAPGQRLLLLSWDETTPLAVARRLVSAGFGASQVTVLSDMGGADERRCSGPASDWQAPSILVSALNVVAVDCVVDTPGAGIARSAGRPERLFDTAGSTGGQITKREVRASVLALLAPRAGETLWDIGAGSGAIAIEWMLAHPANRAVALEANSERAAQILVRAEHLGVPGLDCRHGRAPEAITDDWPSPDAIFIGGGLTTQGLLARCLARLAPGGRLMATAVTLEGEAILAAAYTEHGGTLRRIQIENAAPLGGFHGWQPRRTVTLWCSIDDEDVHP